MLRTTLAISVFVGACLAGALSANAADLNGGIMGRAHAAGHVRYSHRHRYVRHAYYPRYPRVIYAREHVVGEVFGDPVFQIFTNRTNTHLPY